MARASRVDDALQGVGARLVGGRWNSKGTALVYTSESLELAVLEAMMHITLEEVPADQMCIRFSIPNEAILTADVNALPEGWDAPGPYTPQVQAFGDRWLASVESLALAIPASVLPLKRNILINPAHPRIAEVQRIEVFPFTWPERLLDVMR